MSTPYECREFGRNLIVPTTGVEQGGALTISAAAELTADSPRLLYLDASGGIFTLKLPSSAYEGLTFRLCENADSGNAVTVSGNGYTINGSASLTMNAAGRVRELRFNGTEYRVISAYN